MTQPQDPAAEAPEIIGPPPDRRTLTLEIDLDRLPSTATAVGVALVGAAVVMAAMYARMHDGLDGSTFTVGVLAVAGLLAVSAGAQVLQPDLDRRAALVSWPGAIGAAGSGVLLAVLLNGGHSTAYLSAALTLVLSVAGYLLSRGGPFVVSAIAALAVIYIAACGDLIDLGNSHHPLVVVGAEALIFIFAVTALGWIFPSTRVLSAMVVGAASLFAASNFGPILLFTFTTSFAVTDSSGPGPGPEPSMFGPAHTDIWVLLLYCAALAALWAGCSLATGFVGFRILIAVLAVIAIPLASLALAISHPTWWEVALSAAGGAVLVAAGFGTVSSRR